MITFITTIHVILCLLLILIILLQSGKGAEMGAVFGGSSQTIFGSRGAATFLSKVTTFCAVGFMLTSLALVYMTANESSRSIMDSGGKGAQNGAAAAASVTPDPAAQGTASAVTASPTASPTPAAAKQKAK